jgi:hypothetical protein
MNEENEPTLADYCATVDRFIGAIDHVLATGRRAQRRTEEFYRRHNLAPGFGAQALNAATLPTSEREIHQRIIALTESLYRQHLSPVPVPMSHPSTASRALGQRTRI